MAFHDADSIVDRLEDISSTLSHIESSIDAIVASIERMFNLKLVYTDWGTYTLEKKGEQDATTAAPEDV